MEVTREVLGGFFFFSFFFIFPRVTHQYTVCVCALRFGVMWTCKVTVSLCIVSRKRLPSAARPCCVTALLQQMLNWLPEQCLCKFNKHQTHRRNHLALPEGMSCSVSLLCFPLHHLLHIWACCLYQQKI